MTSAVPFSRPHHPAPTPGDATYAPHELMMGPGRSWDAEVRWSWVDIRIGGHWRPGRLERWRIHLGSVQWVALVRWGDGVTDWGWYLFDPTTIRVAPAPRDSPPPAQAAADSSRAEPPGRRT